MSVVKEILDKAVKDGKITTAEAATIMEGCQTRVDQVEDLMANGKTDEANELLARSGIRLVETETDGKPVDMLVTIEGLGDAGMELIDLMRDRGMNVQVTD
ncbi:MAG: hypothetical protein Q7R63_01985 [bacterium]|nr:hypothetical protein [bacterium]